MYAYTRKYQQVDLKTSPSAYGEIMTVRITPVIQTDFTYGVNTEIFDTDFNSGQAADVDSNLCLECSGSAGSYAQINTKKLLRYRPGQGNGIRFSAIFTRGSSGTKQIYGVGDTNDGLFIGFNGTRFGIMRRSYGQEHWTYQEDFSLDKLDGQANSAFQIDPSKGNVFDIQYQWLGYGAITYNVEDPKTGLFIPFHRIEYSNTSIKPSTEFGSNPVLIRVETNETTSTPPVIRTASLFGYLEGELVYTGPTFGASGTKTGIGTSQTNLVTLKNETTYKTKTNKISIKTKGISFSAEGSQPVVFQVRKNATLGGTPSFSSISTESVISKDNAGTTVTGGTLLASFTLNKVGSIFVSERDFEAFLAPGETLTFSAAVAGGNSDTVASVNWVEDH
jgi:hypothetical protein